MAICGTITHERTVQFSNVTYYYSDVKLNFSDAQAQCQNYYGLGHSLPVDIPGMESEHEFLQVQYIFRGKFVVKSWWARVRNPGVQQKIGIFEARGS